MSSINLLFVFTWIADYFFVCFWCPEGTVIVVAAFYSSELHGELFDVFINLRPACLGAAGWLQDLGAPCLLHLTCAQESSITCPAWGLRWLVGYTMALEKIKLHFPAQGVKREQFSLIHMPLVYDRFELELYALINEFGFVWQRQVRRYFCVNKLHRINSELSSCNAFYVFSHFDTRHVQM